MVLWQGLTEGGTAVPVQVTAAGKVVAEGQQGQEGPPGPPGPPGPQGEYGPGDDVDLGTATFSGSVDIADWTASTGGIEASKYGLYIRGEDGSDKSLVIYDSGTAAANESILLRQDGSASFKGSIACNNAYITGTAVIDSVYVDSLDGTHTIYLGGGSNENALYIYDKANGSTPSELGWDGSASYAGNKCGFTAAGEIYFTSRSTRYKLEVAGGLCNAIPYTREMELRERVEDKRKPRPTDSVPED